MQKPLQNRGSMEGLELIPQHRRQMHKTFSPSMRFCQKGLSIMKVYLQSMLSR